MFDKISARLRLAFEFLKVLLFRDFAVRLREVVFLISRLLDDKDSWGGAQTRRRMNGRRGDVGPGAGRVRGARSFRR